MIAIKTGRTQIHFLSDVLVTVASLDLKVRDYWCRARPHAVWVPHFTEVQGVHVSSFVRGVLRSTTSSFYENNRSYYDLLISGYRYPKSNWHKRR